MHIYLDIERSMGHNHIKYYRLGMKKSTPKPHVDLQY